MKRAVMAVAGTIAGLVALLGYKSSAPKRSALTSPLTTTDPSTTTAPPVGATPQTAPPTTAAPGASSGTRTITGPVENNRYGPVQVRLTMSGGHITDVTAVQLPQDRQRSAEISQEAAPILSQEVMQAQSANIDTVSGATYTSEGYAQSVQAALDQLHA